MVVHSPKQKVKEKIDSFFERKSFSSDELRKIRNVAMKHRIKFGNYRARFCKKCFTDLRKNTTRTTKQYKTTRCLSCGYFNKIRIS